MIDLTSSPNKIRTSILQEAMQGKLTQQLPEDGNAINLVKKINNDNKQLNKGKKEKKQKKLLNNEENHFKIPRNWQWIRLNNITEIHSGLNYKRNNLSKNMDDVRIIRGGNISNDFELLLNDNDYRIDKRFIKNENVLLKENQLIMPVSTSPKQTGKVAIVPKLTQAVAAGGFVYQITPLISDCVISKFIMYALSCPKIKANILSITNLSGSALSNIPKTKLMNLIIPLPPLSEQKRIVEKLDSILPKVQKINVLVNRLQELRNNFPKRLKASLLKDAMQGKLTKQLPADGNAINLVEEIKNEKKQLIKDKKIKRSQTLSDIGDDEFPFDIPNNWQWVRLGNIANLVIGKTPSRHNQDYWNGDIPWVSVRDMNNDTLYKTNEGITKKAESDKFKNNIIPKGTMLMSFKLSIGKVCILGMPAYHNEAIVSFNFFKYSDELKAFLFPTIHFLTKFAHSKNAIQGKTLNKTSLNNMLIPLPPLEEQKRIVNKLNHLFKELT